jgi:hypothetical protein
MSRETREGWPLLTGETEVNGDSKSTITIIGVLPWLVRWPCRVRTRDFCVALAALVGPVQNIFSSILYHFNSFVHIAQQSGQAAMLVRLSLGLCPCVCQRACP